MKLSAWTVRGYTGLVLISGVWGCSPKATGIYAERRAALASADDLGLLLQEAGLAAGSLPSSEITAEQARRLRMQLRFALADGNMKSYGPRVTLEALLSEVSASVEPVSRQSLNERLRRFGGLTVLRPDGYLALALTGDPVQCVGPVQMQERALQAGEFKVGSFYSSDGDSFREEVGVPSFTSLVSGADTIARPK